MSFGHVSSRHCGTLAVGRHTYMFSGSWTLAAASSSPAAEVTRGGTSTAAPDGPAKEEESCRRGGVVSQCRGRAYRRQGEGPIKERAVSG